MGQTQESSGLWEQFWPKGKLGGRGSAAESLGIKQVWSLMFGFTHKTWPFSAGWMFLLVD